MQVGWLVLAVLVPYVVAGILSAYWYIYMYVPTYVHIVVLLTTSAPYNFILPNRHTYYNYIVGA
jgi:hypothetical protein